MDTKIRLTHRRNTDVAHLDFCEALESETVEVADFGDQIGFPGQVLVRFNPATGQVYGLTIQGYTSFKRKLMWKHRTLRFQAALEALVERIKELCGRTGAEHLPALSH
jgi:hypothetical protein